MAIGRRNFTNCNQVCSSVVLAMVLFAAIFFSLPVSAEPLENVLPAFPGAVGQGAVATGGRGGDVYRVTNLLDYDSKKDQPKIPGSFRHAIRSTQGARTIVFDVGGAIELAGPLEILKSNLTIAGQTSPGGITLWGYPVDISRGSDIIIRFLRIRTGDFNARTFQTVGSPSVRKEGKGNNDLDGGSANASSIGHGCNRVIIDHSSFSWSIDETLSVTNCRDVTVQHCIIAESLNDSFHPKGLHGYGSLIRGLLIPEDQEAATGGYTFFGNLWAHHRARNPSIAGEQFLKLGRPESERRRTDVNLINNVVYNWKDQPTHRSSLGQVRVNLIGNYYINGPSKRSKHIFNESDPNHTSVYQRNNYHDRNQNHIHDGEPIESPSQIEQAFRGFDEADVLMSGESGQPFGFLGSLERHILPADKGYQRVVRTAGASLNRDAVDQRVIESLVHRSGAVIDSQEEFRRADGTLPGIDDRPSKRRPSDFDTDSDGMSNEFEVAHGLDPSDPEDRNGTGLSPLGYTNLEVYLNSLVTGPVEQSSMRHQPQTR